MKRTVSYRELCVEAVRLSRLRGAAFQPPIDRVTRLLLAQSIVGPCGTVHDGPERDDMPVIEWPDSPEGLLL